MSMCPERSLEVVVLKTGGLSSLQGAVDGLYAGDLDVVAVRDAFPRDVFAGAGEQVARLRSALEWRRPARGLQDEDIELLGVSLTPSTDSPAGPDLDEYTASVEAHKRSVEQLFVPGFDLQGAIERVLGCLAGGREPCLPRTASGQAFAPYTLRSLGAGQGISAHVDYHYGLPAYDTFRGRCDTSTSLSFFVPLALPEAGGELVVYGPPRDAGQVLTGACGRLDPERMAAQCAQARLQPEVGDLLLFASGRRMHRVCPVQGPRPRITLGGFAARGNAGNTLWYWS